MTDYSRSSIPRWRDRLAIIAMISLGDPPLMIHTGSEPPYSLETMKVMVTARRPSGSRCSTIREPLPRRLRARVFFSLSAASAQSFAAGVALTRGAGMS